MLQLSLRSVGPCGAGRGRRHSPSSPLRSSVGSRRLERNMVLKNSTLVEVRRVMNLVYKHGQRYGLLPRSEEGNPIHFVRQSSKSDFEPVILTLPQVLDILRQSGSDAPHHGPNGRGHGVARQRNSGSDVERSGFRGAIDTVFRAYVYRRFGAPKSKAPKAPVPMHPLLAAHLLAWRQELSTPPTKTWFFRVFAPRAPSLPRPTCWLLITCAWLPRRRESRLRRVLSDSTHSGGHWLRSWSR